MAMLAPIDDHMLKTNMINLFIENIDLAMSKHCWCHILEQRRLRSAQCSSLLHSVWSADIVLHSANFIFGCSQPF